MERPSDVMMVSRSLSSPSASSSSFLVSCRLLHPQNQEVGQKLGIATGLMFTLPFIAFYVAMWTFSDWKNRESWAGAVAIVMTNIVVGGYCYVAYMEDRDVNDEGGPKIGASKQRVD